MARKGYLIIICCLLLIITGLLYTSTNASSGDPGTIADPLVTKSYVDEKLDALLTKIDQQGVPNSNTNNQNTNTEVDYAQIYADIDKYIETKLTGTNLSDNAYSKFEVIGLEPGSKLICSESTEVILRAGSATVITNETGDGLADITIGIDLAMGVAVPKNHLLIVPRTDGRGLQIVTKAWIMVKGEYTIADK